MQCFNVGGKGENPMLECLPYLLRFLLGPGNESLAPLVSYGDDGSARIVIEPSGFFSEGVYLTEKSLPLPPLSELEGVPILFGTPTVREEGGRLFLGADLIASAFFLLSRYEECVRRNVRDRHGRFPGRESLPYRAGLLRRPIVDEYGALLRRLFRRAGLDVKEPNPGFSHVYLTHDVDEIWTWNNYYRALRSTAKRLLTNQPEKIRPLLSVWNYQKYDPVYTFPWLKEQDEALRTTLGTNCCTPVYFFMGCEKRLPYDSGYISNPMRTKSLFRDLSGGSREIGYHVSYAASLDKTLVSPELVRLRQLSGRRVRWSRNHFLASREPEDFYTLIGNGITDDFTMGYADEAGFRLGTCRPVKWIDPIRQEVTPLTLHHLTAMDCTLDSPDYMGIQSEEEAFSVVKGLLDAVHAHGGETVLLWHSPSVDPYNGTYQRSLYQRTLELLTRLIHRSCQKPCGPPEKHPRSWRTS